MFSRYPRFAVAAMTLIVAAGCGRHLPNVSDPLPANQIRATLKAAFQSADAPIRDTVNKVADEIDQHQVVAAYADLNDILDSPGLTDEQSIDATRARMTIGPMVQQAADSGDQQAAASIKAVQHH